MDGEREGSGKEDGDMSREEASSIYLPSEAHARLLNSYDHKAYAPKWILKRRILKLFLRKLNPPCHWPQPIHGDCALESPVNLIFMDAAMLAMQCASKMEIS